jgi:O-acetyl-ADP-ribose deacetylase (regulator of RNase III)
MPLLISRNDITQLSTDAIVNAANTQLQMGGGVCGAIFRAAGPAKLQDACNKLAPIKTGEAVITDGFDSKAKYIIHTAGPVYKAGDPQQEKQLYMCYHNSLTLAAKKKLTSIAFPLISSGIYGYPPDKALSTAIKAIHDFLGAYDGDITVYMIVYNDNAFAAAQKLYDKVESFIDEHLIVDDTVERRLSKLNIPASWNIGRFSAPAKETCCDEAPFSIDDVFDNMEDSFNKLLFKYIRQKNMTNVEVYKNANIDRRLFSKIISNENYTPNKNTILALAIALKLDIDETRTLLSSAGYAISHSSKADLIIEYYITHQDYKNYNIYDLNFLLFKYDQEQLGQI